MGRCHRPSATVLERRAIPYRRRHGVEYGLVVAIVCFAALSTFNAIGAKAGAAAPDRVAVRYQ